MKVTVVAFNAAEAHKAKEGLTKLKKGVNEFRRDLRDQRADLETVESFVKGLRVVADYFEGFIKDEVNTDVEVVDAEQVEYGDI